LQLVDGFSRLLEAAQWAEFMLLMNISGKSFNFETKMKWRLFRPMMLDQGKERSLPTWLFGPR
jgi:hypothetical protein